MTVSFSASSSFDESGSVITLNISSEMFELHVALRIPEIARLDEVLSTPWQGGALQLGTSGVSAAWWSCDDRKVAICVGHSDQTWDFSISFPASEFVNLRESVKRELAALENGQ